MNQVLILLTQTVPEGRVFGFDTQTLIQVGIQALNGVILAVALTAILYKPVKAFLQKRSERIQSEIDGAYATQAEANELIREYEAKLAAIDEERTRIVESARTLGEDEARAILEDAREEAAEIKKRELESVQAEKERMYEEVRLHAIDLSALIAQRYISREMDDEARKAYSQHALAQMEESGWPN